MKLIKNVVKNRNSITYLKQMKKFKKLSSQDENKNNK